MIPCTAGTGNADIYINTLTLPSAAAFTHSSATAGSGGVETVTITATGSSRQDGIGYLLTVDVPNSGTYSGGALTFAGTSMVPVTTLNVGQSSTISSIGSEDDLFVFRVPNVGLALAESFQVELSGVSNGETPTIAVSQGRATTIDQWDTVSSTGNSFVVRVKRYASSTNNERDGVDYYITIDTGNQAMTDKTVTVTADVFTDSGRYATNGIITEEFSAALPDIPKDQGLFVPIYAAPGTLDSLQVGNEADGGVGGVVVLDGIAADGGSSHSFCCLVCIFTTELFLLWQKIGVYHTIHKHLCKLYITTKL